MSKAPKVSVVSIAYNQEKYIREMLASIVMQKANFDFEVIIADDCSTDKTPDIIREYAKAYPDIIKPVFRKKNIGAVANFIDAMQQASGTYIALCEGDDYWTDPEKLQRQSRFLDDNPAYSLCFHSVKVFFENRKEKDYIYPLVKDEARFTTTELLKENFIQTNSVMYRRQDYKNLPLDILPLDWYLHLYHAQFGKIGFIDKVMSAYRRHPGGLWWNSYADIDKIWQKHGLSHLALYAEFLKLYGSDAEHKHIINKHIIKMMNTLIETDKKYKKELVVDALERFPQNAEMFVVDQYHELEDLKIFLEAKTEETKNLQHRIQEKDQLLGQRDREISIIKSSRAWRLRNKIAKLVGKGAI